MTNIEHKIIQKIAAVPIFEIIFQKIIMAFQIFSIFSIYQ